MIIANKKAFTLLELVIAIALISLAITGILRLLQEGLGFVDRTRQDVVAINLARQGVEAVFNIRNTNWYKWSGKKDPCWLLKDPFASSSTTDCESVDWMGSGYYILSDQNVAGQHYFALSGVAPVTLDLANGIQAGEEMYALCPSAQGREECPGQTAVASEGKFYRQIIGKGVYRKDSTTAGGQYIECQNGADVDQFSVSCGDAGPKEFRFCVRVASYKQGSNIIEQCSVITNFH